jgi:hypothetical protein
VLPATTQLMFLDLSFPNHQSLLGIYEFLSTHICMICILVSKISAREVFRFSCHLFQSSTALLTHSKSLHSETKISTLQRIKVRPICQKRRGRLEGRRHQNMWFLCQAPWRVYSRLLFFQSTWQVTNLTLARFDVYSHSKTSQACIS